MRAIVLAAIIITAATIAAAQQPRRHVPTAGIVLDLITAELGPIVEGVRIGRDDDKSTWAVFFKPGTTDAQRKRAQQIAEAFDPKSWTPPPSEIEVLKKRIDDLTKGK